MDFGFFSFTPFGLPVLVLGVAYMLAARRLLNAAPASPATTGRRPSLRDWIGQYQLSERAYRVRVTRDSPLIGQRLQDLSLRASGVNLLAIERSRGFATDLIRPVGRTELQVGDILLLDVPAPDMQIEALRSRFAVEALPLGDGSYFTDRSQDIGMVEVILPPDSALVGQTVLKARVRRGVRHDGHRPAAGTVGARTRLADREAEGRRCAAAVRLLEGHQAAAGRSRRLRRAEPAGGTGRRRCRWPNKALQALAALAVAIGLMVSGLVPNVQAALIGCLLMGLCRLRGFYVRVSLGQLEDAWC